MKSTAISGAGLLPEYGHTSARVPATVVSSSVDAAVLPDMVGVCCKGPDRPLE